MALRKFILKIILLGTLLSNAATADAQYNKDYFYWASRRCLMNREYQEAIRVLNILLRADPDAAEGYFLRGVAKFNLDDLLGADTDFSAAIVKNPVFTTAYIYRALTRTRMGNYDDALQDFREAIDLRPDCRTPITAGAIRACRTSNTRRRSRISTNSSSRKTR